MCIAFVLFKCPPYWSKYITNTQCNVSPNSVSNPLWAVSLSFLSVTGYWQKILEGGWQTDSLSDRHTHMKLYIVGFVQSEEDKISKLGSLLWMAQYYLVLLVHHTTY